MWAVLHSEGHAETGGGTCGPCYIVKDMQRLGGHMRAVLHSEGHAETSGAHVGRVT